MTTSKKFDSEKFKSEIIQQLKTDERYKEFFDLYQPTSVESFINTFAREKTMWYQYGDMYMAGNRDEQTRWIDQAHSHLKTILQKKLFDAQCLWRAEQIHFKEIVHSYDFNLWINNILNCPFIEPINEEDIQLYIDYLQQKTDFEDLRWEHDWQSFNEIREAYLDPNSSGEVPEWYEYHMSHTGTGVYCNLPDIREEKESRYMTAWRDSIKAERDIQMQQYEATRDKRPFLNPYDHETCKEFIQKYDSKETLEYYKAYKHWNRHREANESLDEILSMMMSESGRIPIEAHNDWREAVRLAYGKYKAERIIEYLPMAWEEYMMNKSLGIAFPLEAQREFEVEFRNGLIDKIIKGRVYLGEEPNMDF